MKFLKQIFKKEDDYFYQLPSSNFVFKSSDYPISVFKKQSCVRWKMKESINALLIQGTMAGDNVLEG
jgi:hypothetical protein